MKNIFTKGYTTKKSDTKKHGIGLKISEKIVNKYNGSISVYNTYRNKEGKESCPDCTDVQRYLCMDIII
ncbi:MAG: ATP-binding protein [Lachnospiraceae bacterium]|nr:ATP-binding protein [Lachnospiraceae bacterium]